MQAPNTLFDRLISQPRRPGITLGVAFLLLLAPFIIAWAGGSLKSMFADDRWRMLSQPTMILYILVVSPRMARMEAGVVNSLRPLVLVEDADFEHLIREAVSIPLWKELIAFGVGALLGLSSTISFGGSISWLGVYWGLSSTLLYGLLAWVIYISMASTRLTGSILRQPLGVDPFDITPFNAIGRQSLLISLVFVGGITLSLLFNIFQPGVLSHIEFWLSYIPLMLVTVLVFILNMQPTHRILAAAKAEELRVVQRHLQRACRNLLQRLEAGQEFGSLATEINALVAYEERLQRTKTWPYNTEMLRTLVFTVLIPGGTVLGRLIVNILYD